MAISTTFTTRTALKRLTKALKEFAREQGWKVGEYQILFRVLEDWGRITMLFVVKDFGGQSEREMWGRVFDYLEKSLKPGGDIGFSIGLSVRTQEQVDRGGMYAIPEGYVEEELLLGAGADDV
jgi:hypothetical protein